MWQATGPTRNPAREDCQAKSIQDFVGASQGVSESRVTRHGLNIAILVSGNY